MFSSLAFKIGAPIVALLLAAGAGWWFFIREDNEVQEEASDITDEVRDAASSTPAATGTGTAAGTGTAVTTSADSSIKGQAYRIVPGQSEAWYLAPEKLASLPTSSVAKGTTADVTGEFFITDSGLDPAKTTTFTVKLTSLKSDESRRDGRVQTALETNRFAEAKFTAKTLTGLPASFGATDTVMQLTGTLDLHGVQKEVAWELKAKQDGDIISVLGTVELKYSDFGINKPDIGGFVTVEDTVTIQVQLFLTKA